ncbi:hypothetical protein AGR1B_pAt30125 [Agrobacterium fabacearum S56]|nr:hypothetical protein AGR1B_pAt30125 [Agrobacterium fabacearum S56]
MDEDSDAGSAVLLSTAPREVPRRTSRSHQEIQDVRSSRKQYPEELRPIGSSKRRFPDRIRR